jgi:predicted Co/Zn/Cd cation transporter (cation efflux family)
MSTKTLIICIAIGLAVGIIMGLISRFVFEIDDGVAAIITVGLTVAVTCGGVGVTSAKKKNK